MKSILFTTCLLLTGSLLSNAADIFSAPPKPSGTDTPQFATAAAFLAATRSGEVPNLIEDWMQTRNRVAIGQSVIGILRNEYKVPMPELRHDTASLCGLLLSNITKYELEGGKDAGLAKTFQSNRKQLADDMQSLRNTKFVEAFDSLAKDYARAVRESIGIKQERDDRRQAAETEKQRVADMAEQKQQEERRQMKVVADAQAASKRAEDESRATAVKGAMEAQAKVKQERLQEILASPTYQLWQTSLRVEEGLRMIADGQRVLGHDDAVQREAGVADLAARRAAGERVVAGKRLVEDAFSSYRKLGGTASTPDEVRAGPDPAAQYR